MQCLRTSATMWQVPRALLYQIPRRNFTAATRRFNTTLERISSDSLSPLTRNSEPSPSIQRDIAHKENSQNGPAGVSQGTDAGATPEKTVKPSRPYYVGARELYLHLSPKKTLRLPYTYLRDLCQCRTCKDEHSKQRSFRTSDIPADIAPKQLTWNGKILSITWASDISGSKNPHVSTWNRSFLNNPVLNPHRQHSHTEPLIWKKSMMDRMQHWVSYEDYMNNEFKFALSMRQLQRLGLIFVKDIPESREMVEKIATRMGPLRNTFYGFTFDVRTVPEATNVAYTNQFLGFHMDLMYMNEPPGYQLLHCLENSCSGGESMFGDTFHAAKVMKWRYPKEYNMLREQRLGYEYRHENHIYYNERPVFEHDPKSGHLIHVNYSPPFQSPLPASDGRGHDVELVNKLRDSLSKFASILDNEKHVFEMKLNPGECVIFDNRRILHARRAFDSSEGSRWLAGAYVDTDALLSRFAVCRRQHPLAWIPNIQKISEE